MAQEAPLFRFGLGLHGGLLFDLPEEFAQRSLSRARDLGISAVATIEEGPWQWGAEAVYFTKRYGWLTGRAARQLGDAAIAPYLALQFGAAGLDVEGGSFGPLAGFEAGLHLGQAGSRPRADVGILAAAAVFKHSSGGAFWLPSLTVGVRLYY